MNGLGVAFVRFAVDRPRILEYDIDLPEETFSERYLRKPPKDSLK